MANSRSSGNGQVKQAVAMASPRVPIKSRLLQTGMAGFVVRRVAVQSLVHAQTVIVRLKESQLSLQILGIPKEQMIQVFASDRPDQPLYKRMRPGNMRHRLHRVHPENSEVGLPALGLEQRIVVKAEPDGQALAGNGLAEHATESRTIDGDCLHPKTHNPAGKLIHDDEDPVRFEQDRFRPEQVHAPETVLGMPKEAAASGGDSPPARLWSHDFPEPWSDRPGVAG